MARYSYERLSGEAAQLLEEETSRRYGHAGTMLVFDSGPLGRPDGGVDFAAVRELIEAKLHLVPGYRQKLRWIPFENHPVWVDDGDFNLDYHLRHTSLARPGNAAQLRTLAARLQAQRLDRDRPLWEYWIVEGLEGGRFALLAKTHNALLASTGADLLQVLLSPRPEDRIEPAPPYFPRPRPSAAELVWDEVVRQARLPRRALERGRAMRADPEQALRGLGIRVNGIARMLGYSLPGFRETPLNGPIGPHRRVDHLVLPLEDAHRVRQALGGSVLDVVLATTAGAVARYLVSHYVNPATIDFRVGLPVARRDSPGHADEWVLELPIWERDPRERLRRIRESTSVLQRERPAAEAKTLFPVEEWARSELPGAGARGLASRAQVNLRIASVPGPRVPLYLHGAKLVECYGNVALVDQCGLGIAVFGYDGKLCWGLNADFDRVPDLDRFSEALRLSFQELLDAADDRTHLTLVQGQPTG